MAVGLTALTACSAAIQPPAAPGDAAPAVTATSAAPANAPASSTAAATRPPGTSTAPAAPCPVTAATLMDVLTEHWRPAAGLKDVSCVRGYAFAASVYDGVHQPSDFVFGFDTATAGWRMLNVGTDDICTGHVPADIAAKLHGC
ncbi:hypothetical protein GCM10020218_104350 [Dactylosporangium vinaceum]